MADEKNKKGSQEEAVGLDKETPQNNTVFGKLKKYLLPAAIGAGSMLIVLVVYIFILNDAPTADKNNQADTAETSRHKDRIDNSDNSGESTKHNISNLTKLDQKNDGETHAEKIQREVIKKGNKTDTISLADENNEEIEIDTAAIMKDLDFIFATPEQEKIIEGMTPQDSIDTLNWLEKEMSQLDKKIAAFEKKRKELEELEDRVNQSLLKIDQAESARIINLARLYDGMKPEEVGKLFANLSDDIVISILPRMKPANASKILALLPSKRAAKISTSMITVLEDK